jgi:putative ABC transport system permease protein
MKALPTLVRPRRWSEDFTRDLRYAVRLLHRQPAFAAVVVTTLALGIGANTTIFSVVDSVLIRPLPYRDPERLVAIFNTRLKEPGSKLFQQYRDFEGYARHARSFESLSLATWAVAPQVWRGRRTPRELLVMPVDASFFTMLGVQAALGRTFLDDDARAGCAVVLSHRFWENELGCGRHVVGATLNLDRRSCTVRGVMPPGFVFYPAAAQIWMALGPDFPTARDDLNVGVFARLKRGVTPERAQIEVATIHARMHQHDSERELSPFVSPLQREFTWLASRTLQRTLIALSGAVAVVLLIACLNVATLLIGRSASRARELAIRSAIGAARVRLVRQLFSEALALSLIGGAVGTLLAFGAVKYFRDVNPIELPPGADVAVHARMLVFTTLLSVLSTVLFGLVPSWRSALVNPSAMLKAGGRGTRGGSSNRVMRGLVVAQLALSLMLIVASALLIGSVRRMMSEPMGFDPTHLFTTRITLPAERYGSDELLRSRCRQFRERVTAMPGVSGATLASDVAFAAAPTEHLDVADLPPSSERQAASTAVDIGYFDVYRIPLLHGRVFDDRDRENAEPTAIVNLVTAERYFGGATVVGRRIRLGEPERRGPWLTIVGVVGNVKGTSLYQEMRWSDAGPMVFRPLAQAPSQRLSLAFRLRGDLDAIGAAVHRRITEIDPELPISEIVPADRWLSQQLTYPRFRSVAFSVFAALALALASIGLYGILWQFVAERRQELAVRIALGASRADVAWLVARHGAVSIVAGLAIGGGLSWMAGQSLSAFLYETRTFDPRPVVIALTVMLGVAAIALAVPVGRATRVDPIEALREE